MTTETTNSEREDSGEDAGLEEENEREHCDSTLAFHAHGRGDEDHDAGHEDHEDETGLDDHHQTSSGETTDGKEALADSVAV